MSALIYCPFPDAVTAERVGAQLLDEGLIACINIGDGIRSLYIWNGEHGASNETTALLKTNFELLGQAVARLEALHPYDAPAILGWRCDASGEAARAWLDGMGKEGAA